MSEITFLKSGKPIKKHKPVKTKQVIIEEETNDSPIVTRYWYGTTREKEFYPRGKKINDQIMLICPQGYEETIYLQFSVDEWRIIIENLQACIGEVDWERAKQKAFVDVNVDNERNTDDE